MLLSDEDVEERLASPNNLLNRLRNATTPAAIVSMPPPTTKDLDIDVDNKLAATQIRNKATAIMGAALDELKVRLGDVQKPERLASIAAEMNKVLVTAKDQEKNRVSQIIVYAPQVISENHFDTIIAQNEE